MISLLMTRRIVYLRSFRKEIEGKIVIFNPKVSTCLAEGKVSLEEFFVDTTVELLSVTSIGTHYKDSIHISPAIDNIEAMEIDRKRRTMKCDGNSINPKLAR